MSWKKDLELSYKSQSYADTIYKKVFPVQQIKRTVKRDENGTFEDEFLDRRMHIDVLLRLKNGITLTGQEKVLRNKFSRFNTFTIEFYQNRFTKEKGEFFNLGAQFFLHGYWNVNEDGFEKWYIIKVLDFLLYLRRFSIQELQRHTKKSSGRASFFCVKYEEIPQDFIFAKGGSKCTTK